VHLQQEAVLAGDAVALGDLEQVGREFGDLGQLPGGGPDPDERGACDS
jgi:hypothetical protein